jgi:hypothetical protein
MNQYKNRSADIKIRYFVDEYEKLEKIFNLEFHEFALMLALMGKLRGEKLPLDIDDGKNKEHTFSRTTYDRAVTEFDSYFGLLSILDNIDLSYDEVINNIAFQKTEESGLSFAKQKNVNTFYGYLISGIEKMYGEFYKLGSNSYDVASCIHDFLSENQDAEIELIESMLMEELETDNNE